MVRSKSFSENASPDVSTRFNPCSIGWCARSSFCLSSLEISLCFNPCSIGWCARRRLADELAAGNLEVSILVLLDGALEENDSRLGGMKGVCFNPCSIGWCARSAIYGLCPAQIALVSILVLLDGALEDELLLAVLASDFVFQSLFYWMVRSKTMKGFLDRIFNAGFNPCSIGWCARREERLIGFSEGH